MKKSYILLTLAAVLELTSCTAHFSKNLDNMISIDGNTISLNDVFASYGGSSKSASAINDVLNNIYVQLAEPRNSAMDALVESTYQTEYEQKATDNANTNRTSVKEEKEKLLQAAGVDTEEQYRNQLYLKQQQTNLDERFATEGFLNGTQFGEYFQTNAQDQNNPFISAVGNSSPMDQYINENYPYHMRHILVKVDGSDKFRSEITADQAKKLSQVVQELGISGNPGDSELSFGQIALEKTEDDASKSKYGDTGLMDKIGSHANFVNEFRLGTYAYDMLFRGDANVSQASQAALLPSDTTSDGIMARSLLGIQNNTLSATNFQVYGSSYLQALLLGKVADQTSAYNNKVNVENGNAKNYPRNIIFSNNFNFHGLGFIYVENPASLPGATEAEKVSGLETRYGITNSDAQEVYNDLVSAYGNPNNVSVTSTPLNGQIKYLTETVNTEGVPQVTTADIPTDAKIVYDDKTKQGKGETSDPIMVARVSSSYEGVHFMSIIKDPFKIDTAAMKSYLNINTAEATSRVPASENANQPFRTNTYINYVDKGITASASDYNDRRTEIINSINGRDSNTDFAKKAYIKNKALQEHTVELDPKIQSLVENYIASSIQSNRETAINTFDTAWLSYVTGLQYQISNFSNITFGTLGFSSIYSFNKAVIGKYIVKQADAGLNGTTPKTGVYAVETGNGQTYYTTNDISLASGYQTGEMVLNPAYIISSGTSGGNTSTGGTTTDGGSEGSGGTTGGTN